MPTLLALTALAHGPIQEEDGSNEGWRSPTALDRGGRHSRRVCARSRMRVVQRRQIVTDTVRGWQRRQERWHRGDAHDVDPCRDADAERAIREGVQLVAQEPG